MKEQWKQDSVNEKFYSQMEGHKAVPVEIEMPVVMHARSNEDYCRKTIATLKVLVLLVLLVLLSWTSITLYTNYGPKSTLLVNDETTQEYFRRFGKVALKSKVHLESNQNAASNITSLDNLTVHPYYNHPNENNSQTTPEYSVKTRVVRKADMLELEEGKKEEEFRKWIQSLGTKEWYSNANEEVEFKAEMKRLLDDPDETSDDLQELLVRVILKYRDTVIKIYMENLMRASIAARNSDKVSDSNEDLASNKGNDAVEFDDSNEKSGSFDFSELLKP